MYAHVGLGEDEPKAFLVASGLRLHVLDGDAGFQQPCAASRRGCCTVYENRPRTCRDYRCSLKANYDAGTVSLEAAQRQITDAISLRDTLRAALEDDPEVNGRLTLDQLCKLAITKHNFAEGGLTSRQAHAQLLLDIGALNILLIRHFRTRPSQPLGSGDIRPMQ
jgi:uncharacterized protein